MSNFLRSSETADKYSAHRKSGAMDNGCVLCTAPIIADFSYWKIIPNKFPYDLLAKEHHMLIPKRHSVEKELSNDEYQELLLIKERHFGKYDYTIEATNKAKSIPEHFHLHLIVAKNLNDN